MAALSGAALLAAHLLALGLQAALELRDDAVHRGQILERAGLISRGRDKQKRPCRIEARPLAEANA